MNIPAEGLFLYLESPRRRPGSLIASSVMARTRHHIVFVGSVLVLNSEAVTV
jgi:hypothetical protein